MFRPTVTTFHRMAARAAASASSTSGGVRVCGGVRSTAVVSSYATPSAALVAAPHAGVSSAVMRAEVGGETLLDMKALSPVVLLAIMRILQVITWLVGNFTARIYPLCAVGVEEDVDQPPCAL
eukprot:TRINITY_DN17_c0_g1_i8.p3 TRINITY_DN17_c0_g1~~TRINITY_DN17_c0_g1_i8.p3  ORF type:complete len:123 (+),score=10.54 TRINITY_DN17_c0_g1_i8:53-421(+)